MNTERNDTIDKIQAEEYQFPYHHIPRLDDFPNFSKRWLFAPSYLAAIHLAKAWLSAQVTTHNSQHTHIDIGCGDGGFITTLKAFPDCSNIQFTGVDYDEQAIAWAKAFSPTGTHFVCAPLSSLPQNSYDSGSLIEVLEHIPPAEIADFVDAIYQVLKPKARLFVTVPSTEVRTHKKHYQHFNFAQLQQIFAEKFSIEECAGFDKIGLLDKLLFRLCFGKHYHFEHAYLNRLLVKLLSRTYPQLHGCGRIMLRLRKTAS